MNKITFLILLICGSSSFAQSSNMTNLISSGLGVSLPSMTHGLEANENPVAPAYQASWRVGLTHTTDDGDTNDTAETTLGLGYGESTWGLSASHNQYSTDNGTTKNDYTITGIGIGALIESISLGIGVASYKSDDSAALPGFDNNEFGLLLNPNGMHRFGLVYNVNADDDVYGWTGIGYSYVQSDFALILDHVQFPDNTNDKSLTSLGLTYFASNFQLNISYTKIDDTVNNNDDSNIQIGASFYQDWVQIAVYSNRYTPVGQNTGDLSITAQLFF